MDGEWCRELSSPIRVRRWLELCETPVSVWEWSTCSGGTTPVTHGEKDTGGRRGGKREQGGGGAREDRRNGGESPQGLGADPALLGGWGVGQSGGGPRGSSPDGRRRSHSQGSRTTPLSCLVLGELYGLRIFNPEPCEILARISMFFPFLSLSFLLLSCFVAQLCEFSLLFSSFPFLGDEGKEGGDKEAHHQKGEHSKHTRKRTRTDCILMLVFRNEETNKSLNHFHSALLLSFDYA